MLLTIFNLLIIIKYSYPDHGKGLPAQRILHLSHLQGMDCDTGYAQQIFQQGKQHPNYVEILYGLHLGRPNGNFQPVKQMSILFMNCMTGVNADNSK